jgi:hypothetical protein
MLKSWPLWRQITNRTDGTGADAMSDATRALQPRNDGASVASSPSKAIPRRRFRKGTSVPKARRRSNS